MSLEKQLPCDLSAAGDVGSPSPCSEKGRSALTQSASSHFHLAHLSPPLSQSQLGAQENNTFTFILLPPLVAMRILFAEIFVSVAEREKRAMIYTLF